MNCKAEDNTQYLICKRPVSGANATGYTIERGFVVLKGAIVSSYLTPSFRKRKDKSYEIRMKLEKDGTIVDRIFQYDYVFNSPSQASSVILGHISSGQADWKTESGTELHHI